MPSPDFTFLHSGCMPACSATVDKRFDGYYTLQFAEAGGVELFYENKRHLLVEGVPSFWLAYPGPHIRFHAAPGQPCWKHRYVAFKGPRVARWIANGLWLDGPQSPAPAEAKFYPDRFDTLIELTRRPASDSWAVTKAVNMLEAFLIELAEAHDRAATSVPTTEPWLSELLARLAAPGMNGGQGEGEGIGGLSNFSCATFAHDHGMALSTLRRRFRAATGMPLHEWAVQSRVFEAKRLLGDSDLPVKTVAATLGYNDIYFFTRQFRQIVGVPPAAYRRSRQR